MQNDIDVIFHARKSLLFDNKETWNKREGLFDVTMGAYDGAEICELIGTYLLSKITQRYDKGDIGLYRDDGLAVFKNASGSRSERIKKDIQRIFHDKGLSVEIQCNKKVVDFLDVTLNLNDGSFRPYRKPEDIINYIHADSDHPPSIIKQLPFSVEKRLSSLSSSKEIFDNSKEYYQDTLKRSGYAHELKYTPTIENRERQRRRNIIWFNPPYSKIVHTNIGKSFLSLLDKHFPRGHKFRKNFNRNSVKISYGCMQNLGSMINSHNKKILEDSPKLELGGCNCRVKNNCPLDGHCLSKGVLYQGKLSTSITNYDNKVYHGISQHPFKLRYNNHNKAFNNIRYKNDCELSKEAWKIKEMGGIYSIEWKILKQVKDYNPATKRCGLCLAEKLSILEHKGNNLLNRRSEIISKCRHRNKYMLDYKLGNNKDAIT